jgi:hypothetical protein
MRLLPLVLVLVAACGRRDDPQSKLEREFESSMQNVTLVGQSSRNKKPGVYDEKYYIQSVRRLAGDTWLFTARIRYGGRDVTVPIPITVKWAGDTPVITLTDLNIPKLGTFTARVLIYRNAYSGTWSGHGEGGSLWGKVVKGEQ